MKLLKKIFYTYTIGYRDYQEEIQKFSVLIQRKYSLHLFWIFICYTLIMAYSEWSGGQEFNYKAMAGFLPAVLLLGNWLLHQKKEFIRGRAAIWMGNLFLLFFLAVLEIIYDRAAGYISQTLYKCNATYGSG
ncbi:MAG: hypothetical protein IJP31_02365 [Lachnospiraceae bacterium]|nr:hypothetical protein [Lachnospiraceae bacterium]